MSENASAACGLFAKSGSARTSGTTSTPSSCTIVRAQNDASREASELSIPTRALPHWRSASTKLMTAIGVPQSTDASFAPSS